MSTAVRLDDDFIEMVRRAAPDVALGRQIEHWCKIGKTMEENPDLTYRFVTETQAAYEQVRVDGGEPYHRRTPE